MPSSEGERNKACTAADLHEVSPSIASQNRQGLAGHMQNCVVGYSGDQLQSRVAVLNLAVRKQSCILWPLHPCLYACQQPCTHHRVHHAYKAGRDLQSCDILAVYFMPTTHHPRTHHPCTPLHTPLHTPAHITPAQDILQHTRQAELFRPCFTVQATSLMLTGCQSVDPGLEKLESSMRPITSQGTIAPQVKGGKGGEGGLQLSGGRWRVSCTGVWVCNCVGGSGRGKTDAGNGGQGRPPFRPVSAVVLKRTYSNACCTLSATAYPPRPLARGVAPLGVAAIGVEPPLAVPEVEVRPSRNAAMT